MADIYDLPNKDISEMSDDELRTHLLAMRGRRRTPDPEMKAQAKAKAIKKKGNAAALKTTDELVKGITPEQAAQILAALSKKG